MSQSVFEYLHRRARNIIIPYHELIAIVDHWVTRLHFANGRGLVIPTHLRSQEVFRAEQFSLWKTSPMR